MEKQYSYICPICGNAKALAQEPDVDKITEAFGKMVNAVTNGDMTTETLPYELAEAISDELLKAVDLGLKYGQPDEAMIWMFQNSVFSFSGAKSIQELKELSAALIKDKKLVSLAEFKRIAVKLNTEYNINFLKTEYNSAIAAAQTGTRWWEFRENEEIMPYLQYQTAGDGRVRDSHQQLNGVVKHIRDRFWTKYYPPNGWGCRCEAIQLANSDIKESKETPEIKIPSMFKTNLAHTGIIFPDDSPYYRGINEKDILWLRPSFKKALEPIAKLKSLYPEFTRLELATMYNYTDHEFMYLNPLMNEEITNKFIR
ncbi:MAG: hypothetical protein EOM05_10710, partial [Clostridia bacterium]|nr:hypothetical protein [Clostridia bacterium]